MRAASDRGPPSSLPQAPGGPPSLIGSLLQSVASETEADTDEQLDQGKHS